MQRTSRASSTALLIAASLVLQDERGIAASRIPATSIELSRQALHAAGWPWRQVGQGLRFSIVRAAFAGLERLALPGIQAHFLLRKQRIARWAEQAQGAGFRQILVLGAGFDGLAADLARRHADFRAFEWDHPSTQILKRDALIEANLDAKNLHLSAVDIARDDAHMALTNTSLDQDGPTLVIAEGLLMYLPLDRCQQLLDALMKWFHGPLRIAFSYMEHDKHGAPGFANAHPAVTRWLQRRGEPFLWACRYDIVVSALSNKHLRLLESDDGATAPTVPMPGWIACRGETLCLAEAIR